MPAAATDQRVFEGEVRRVARALWPRAAKGGATIVAGRERDGIFDEGEIIHIVEATASRRRDKVQRDIEKSIDLVRKIRRDHPNKLTKIWIVTAEDPTADQSDLAQRYKKKARCPIEVCSFRSYSNKIIDSAYYLQLRENYFFGSVRNPADDKDMNVPEGEYIPINLLEIGNQQIYFPTDIVKLLTKPDKRNIILVGDYGSGKSMTMRNIFHKLRDMHLSSEIITFPIYLNLRDHFGQSDPTEALLRHGNRIGMPDPTQLIAAWRAGFVSLLLDGFDEVSATRLARGAKKLRQARREAMRLVSAFIDQSPVDAGLIVSGRLHYFDSRDELVSSLGLSPDDLILSLSEFTHEQIALFLQRKGIEEHIPDWLPSRPLLLGYLVVRGVAWRRDKIIRGCFKRAGLGFHTQ